MHHIALVTKLNSECGMRKLDLLKQYLFYVYHRSCYTTTHTITEHSNPISCTMDVIVRIQISTQETKESKWYNKRKKLSEWDQTHNLPVNSRARCQLRHPEYSDTICSHRWILNNTNNFTVCNKFVLDLFIKSCANNRTLLYGIHIMQNLLHLIIKPNSQNKLNYLW